MDGALVNKAKTILSDLAKGGNPFFFAVGFAKPHLPFVAPKKYWDLYDRNTVPLAQFTEHAAESPEFAYHNSGELRAYSDIPGIPGIPGIKSYTTNHIGLPVDKQRELVHGYYAAVSYADAQIGKLLDELERLGLAENTIVVLWGDHGWHLGDHDLWCKHSNFEQATRSPLIISAPWIRKSKTSSPTEFVDIFPTICDLAGVDVPKKLDGESLVPLMKKPGSKVKEFAVSQYPRKSLMGYSIRTDQYRLTYWMKDIYRSSMPFDTSIIVGKELYDYKTDPLETRSEVNNKKYKKVQQELDAQIVKFLKSQQVIN
jgi:arylsulfatase A-like enzyme